MTFYERKLQRLKRSIYSNRAQIDAAMAIRRDIDRYYYQKLNLNALSERHALSKFHLLRIFKRYYGLTPRQYLIDKRVEKSKEYLASGISVTETCFAVGFESLGSFSLLFKTKTGISPHSFQKRAIFEK